MRNTLLSSLIKRLTVLPLAWAVVASPPTWAQITPSASLTLDSSNVIAGGLEHGHAFRGLLDVGLEVDVSAIEGGRVFVQALMQKGDHGSDYAGDIQGYSNIDSHDFESIFEAWYKQSLFDEQLSIKLGWMDGNSDFAATEQGGVFINSSMGFSPTIFAMPTYPDTVLAISAYAALGEHNAISLGVFDGTGNDQFEQTFVIGQFSHHIEQTNVVVGYWNHSESADAQGWYASVDHYIRADVAVYSQVGIADKTLAEIDQHLGLGVVKYGPFNRADDRLGLAFTQANVVAQDEREIAYEAFYLLGLENHFSVMGDVQHIARPSGDSNIDNAWVLTVRVSAEY